MTAASRAHEGSYPNKTNVRVDSDVDIMVKLNDPAHTDGMASWYFSERADEGTWTMTWLREEVHAALTLYFDWVDPDHNTANGRTTRAAVVRESSATTAGLTQGGTISTPLQTVLSGK
ncbi:hypothetical protein AB0I02_22930 [Streptomyces phaeochromogenes]